MAEKLYLSHSLEKTSSETSGSFIYWSDDPASNFDVGDSFRPVPDGPLLQVNKVSIKDNVIGEFNGKPLRQWEVTVEGSTKGQETDVDLSSDANIKYSFSIDKDNKVSGSMEVSNTGSSPAFQLQVGQSFDIPGVGSVTCTEIRGSDNYDSNGVHTWTTTYDSSSSSSGSGSGSDSSSELPDDEETTTYELNGITVRTVAGELLALRRSNNPITKKTFILHNRGERMITTIGSTYQGGTVTRESVVKEKLKVNDNITLIYYKHTIEVES